MRYTLATVLFVAATLAAAADDEKKYTSKDGKYAVQFPAGAKVKTDKQDAGGISINSALAEVEGKAYGVMYTLLPDAVKDVDPKLILDGAEKGAVEKSGGKLVKSKVLAFGAKKYPGRDILVEKDGNKVRTWVILAGTRLYVVLVGGKEDYATGKEATAFLDSFEMTK
jgi:hypothetical protein